MPSNWKILLTGLCSQNLQTLQLYWVELHVLETLLLFSVYEERGHRSFSSLLAFLAIGVWVAFSTSSSAHRDHHCVCAGTELGKILGKLLSQSLAVCCHRTEWFGACNDLKQAFLSSFCIYELFHQMCCQDFLSGRFMCIFWHANAHHYVFQPADGTRNAL